MLDSLPFRNDAAIVLRRLMRSLPTGKGVIGIATCDKGLPAMMMALASSGKTPSHSRPRRGYASAGIRRGHGQGANPGRALCSGPDQPGVRRQRLAAAPAPLPGADASFSVPRQPRRWSARRWDSRCPTPRSRPPASPFGSTPLAAQPGLFCACISYKSAPPMY